MQIYRIYRTKEFDRDFSKLDNSLKQQVAKAIEQLNTMPYTGKPLGYEFFREKKVRCYRVYYLIYEEYVVVFVISLSDKKDQQTMIDKIKGLLPYYRDEIKNKMNL